MKPRWLRTITPTLWPSSTPASESEEASAFERRWTSSNVSVPSSSMIAVSCGKRIADAAKPAAGVGPQRRISPSVRRMRSGRSGRMKPAVASVRAVCSLLPAIVSMPTCVSLSLKRSPSTSARSRRSDSLMFSPTMRAESRSDSAANTPPGAW